MFAGVFLSVVVISTLIYNLVSNGWYWFYVFDLPNQHILHKDMLVRFLVDDIFMLVPAALFFSLLFIGYRLYQRSCTDFFFHGMFFASMFIASGVSRMHSGGYINVLIPAYLVTALYFGPGLQVALYSLGTRGDCASPSANRRPGKILPEPLRSFLLSGMILAAAGYQLWLLAYDPRAQVPGKADMDAGDAFIATLLEIDGDVFVPFHGFIPTMAGKATHSQGMALEDVFRSTDEQTRDELKDEMRAAIVNKKFSAIILDGEWRFMSEINANYEHVATLYDDQTTFMPKTGMPTRPQMIYLLRDKDAGGE